jgi:anti-sigma28 factor (negative regulator of flagellin synthesis)
MIAHRKHRLNRSAIFRYDGRHEDGMTPSPPERTDRQVGSADMEVKGPGSILRTVPTGPAKSAGPVPSNPSPVPATPTDSVDISSAGKLLDKLSKSPEVRAERLAQIKAEIASGKYDSEEKLEAAMMSLLQMIVNESHD